LDSDLEFLGFAEAAAALLLYFLCFLDFLVADPPPNPALLPRVLIALFDDLPLKKS
jgi:hypothetical protein